MSLDRIVYRARQFWRALRAEPDVQSLRDARGILNHDQMQLFLRMHSADQAHALRVFHRLQQQGENHPDLLIAALLHDVGKIRSSPNLLARVMIVLGNVLFPAKIDRWGREGGNGWHRMFAAARQHPHWGAELAAAYGASSLAVRLISRHQEMSTRVPQTLEDRLLQKLQAVDDDS